MIVAGPNPTNGSPGTPLNEAVNRDHLLAEIVQGLLSAHVRLDLLEERLKAAAGTAVAEQLQPGVTAVNEIIKLLDARMRALEGQLESYGGLEERLRAAAVRTAAEQLREPASALQQHEQTTRKQVDHLARILRELEGAETRFRISAEEGVRRQVERLVAQVEGAEKRGKETVTTATAQVRNQVSVVEDRLLKQLQVQERSISSAARAEQQELDRLKQLVVSSANGTDRLLEQAHHNFFRILEQDTNRISSELSSLRQLLEQERARDRETAERRFRHLLYFLGLFFTLTWSYPALHSLPLLPETRLGLWITPVAIALFGWAWYRYRLRSRRGPATASPRN